MFVAMAKKQKSVHRVNSMQYCCCCFQIVLDVTILCFGGVVFAFCFGVVVLCFVVT